MIQFFVVLKKGTSILSQVPVIDTLICTTVYTITTMAMDS